MISLQAANAIYRRKADPIAEVYFDLLGAIREWVQRVSNQIIIHLFVFKTQLLIPIPIKVN